MDKITLLDKGLEFMSVYAAPSILTGRFVACIIDSSLSTVINAFTNPGRILVQNTEQLYQDKEYDGYTRIHSINEDDGKIIVKLDKGGSNVAGEAEGQNQ